MKPVYRSGILAGLILSLSYTDLTSQAFVTNGSASFTGSDCYQLTPDVGGQAGSIFSQNTIDLTQAFSLDATLFFGCKDANGADGIVFILATSNTALGTGGGGIGYQGITPSIAIEYDDYFNSNFADPTSDHVAVLSMGAVEHNLPTNLAGPINLPNIEDCMDHCFTVSWDPVTLTLTSTLDGNIIFYTGDIVATIFNGNAQVYFGFSSGTGSLSNIHRVCFGPPALAPMSDVSVCAEESIGLQADPNGVAWTWAPDPTLSSSNISNPIASPATSTTYTVIIEYACGYFQNDTVIVTVIPPPVIAASNNGPVCAGESLTLMASGGISYLWSGPLGYSSSSQNPVINNIGAGMSGLYTVTVTDAAGCSAVTSTWVVIDSGPQINIDPPPVPLCENDDPIQLNATPSGGIWSGEISVSGIFDPGYAGEGVHLITYTATDANGCTNTAQVSLTVLLNPEVMIDPPGILCEGSAPIQMTGSPPGGYWSGEITFNGIFNPGDAGSGPHLITYTANDGNGCTNSAQIVVEVVAGAIAAIIPAGPFCATDSLIQLSATPGGGIWGGVANPSGQINPAILGPGIYQVIYSVTFPGGCSNGDTLNIVVLQAAPQVHNLNTSCDSSATSYIVSFTITGGDPFTYWVTGSTTGTLIPGNPFIFTSLPIASGDPYSFIISDASGCDSVILSGNVTCNCTSNAGMMDFNLIGACVGDTISILPATGVVFDPDDTLVYVLHLGFPDSIILMGTSNEFVFGPPLQTGVTYFISTVVGNALPGGGVDLTDPCLSVSFGTPVTWHEFNTGYLTGPSAICEGDSALIHFILQGNGPFDVTYTDGTNNYSLDNILSGHSVIVLPSGTTTYSLLTLSDPAGSGCTMSLDSVLTILVSDVITAHRDVTICRGDSIFLAGSFQSNPGIYYDTLAGTIGCDTVMESVLIVFDPDTTLVYEMTCDSSLAGLFETTLTNQLGCDSIVITNIIYEPPAVQHQYSSGCASFGDTLVVTVLTGQNGCDSIIYLHLDLLPADTMYVIQGDCDITTTGTFTQILTNQYGCDSLVITDIFLLPSDTLYLSSSSCLPADTGSFITVFHNMHGCDSMVIEKVEWLLSDMNTIYATSCEEADTGTVTTHLVNVFGCDSTVQWITTLLPADSCIVISREIFIPNVFSPNGDGYNDLFFISSPPESVAKISVLRIFDRWGGLVFERNNILPNIELHGWDGTGKGKPLGPGVFVWSMLVEYMDGRMEAFTGDITLIR